MDEDKKIQEIEDALRMILAQLDELRQPIAAIKIADAINILSKNDPSRNGDQEA